MFENFSRFLFELKYKSSIIMYGNVMQIFTNNKPIFEFNAYLTNTGHKYKDVTLLTAIYNFNKTAQEFFATYEHTCLDFMNVYKEYCDFHKIENKRIDFKKSWLTYHTVLLFKLDGLTYYQSNNVIRQINDEAELIELYKAKGYTKI